MKRPRLIGFLAILLLSSCGDVEHELHRSKTYAFSEGTILTFQSDASKEQFVVQKVVNGRYEDSRSGTCAKPRLDIYHFQAVHLRPLDTLDRKFNFVSNLYTDCAGFPSKGVLNEPALVSSIIGTYDTAENDRLQWLDEFSSRTSSFKTKHSQLVIRSRKINDVYEFEVENGKRLSKIFYCTEYGFVGYQLKNGSLFELTNKFP